MKTDVDGYPTVCCICGEKIVKARHDSQQHFDHATQEATSWHTTCSPNSHPFYCGGSKTTLQRRSGSWVCSNCGVAVDWVAT